MRGQLAATVSETDHWISVEPAGDRFRVTIGDRVLLVDAERIKPGTWSLLVDGRSLLVDVDLDRDPPWFYTHQAKTPVSVMSAQRRRLEHKMERAGGGHAKGELLKAPIAGRVVNVQVQVGESVEAGTCVAILEAMKMENEIKCSRAGVVQAVHVSAGDSVETGAKLVSLGPPSA